MQRAVGRELHVVLVEGESGFEELASGEVVLVFDAGYVGGFHIFRIRYLRALRREEGVLVVQIVDQETGGENVAAGEVGLNVGEIAETQDVAVVGVDGKRGEDDVVVFAVEGVVKPYLSFFDRAGKGEARQELVEAPSMLVLNRRNEVGGGEAEMVVANAGVEAEQAAGSLAVLGVLAGGLDLNVAESIGADANQQLSVGGLRDVEAIEQGENLVGLGSGDVGLAELILHDSRNEVRDVAIVLRAGIDDVDHVEAADRFLRRNLLGVDGGRRFVDVDDLANFPLVREGDFNVRVRSDSNAGLCQFVETFFFYAELILARCERGEPAASSEVCLAAQGWERRHLQEDSGVWDGDSVFVDDGNGGDKAGLRRGSAGKGERERKEESTHAVRTFYYCRTRRRP